MGLSVVILAAGQGTRMRSAQAKVLHRLGGRALLQHVVDAAAALHPERIVIVYGFGGEAVKAQIHGNELQWVEQAEQNGTGHALAQALPLIPAQDLTLVLYGDVPLITPNTLHRLLAKTESSALALLTVLLNNPSGYGRILRDDSGQVQRIVEDKDASPVERKISEINTGLMAAPAERFSRWLEGIDNNNAQGELYLTDCIARAVGEGEHIGVVVSHDVNEVMGVNDRQQLAALERAYQQRQAQHLMRQGVTLMDPQRFDLRGELVVGQDVCIDINAVFEGRVELADNVSIGANCVIRDCIIGPDTQVLPHSVLDGAQIGARCVLGPFARIRPQTQLGNDCRVGNFVEIKKSVIDSASKINHLSYVGDARIGRRVNIGAGSITCNYDGANKYQTVIGDDAFIGSDTQLIAPVTVGRGATIGAGSTIAKNAPEDELTLSRSKQLTLKGWQRPKKQKD